MGIKYHTELIQHTDEWRAARCGLLTASEMKLVITPAKLQVAANAEVREHINELAAQRVNQYVEPTWFGGAMERGLIDEIDGRNLYRERCAPVRECGFVTNDGFSYVNDAGETVSFTLGYSPDGFVDPYDDGLYSTPGQIEIKSRAQKFQFGAICEDEMPTDFLIQVQTGMLVSGRKWCDFISYCSGMPMFPKRIHANDMVQAAILIAATVFHRSLDAKLAKYAERLTSETSRLIPTVRKPYNPNGDIKGDEE